MRQPERYKGHRIELGEQTRPCPSRGASRLNLRRFFRVCGVAGLVLGLVEPHTALAEDRAEPGKAPPRAGQAGQASVEPLFEFEKRNGEIDQALTVLLRRRRPVSESAVEAGEAMTREAKARATLRANSKGAAAAVIAELDKLRPYDVAGHAALFSLLGVVAHEEAAIQYWSRKLTSGSPRQTRPIPVTEKSREPDKPRTREPEQEDPEVLIRNLALAQLYRAALHGSERAKGAILDAARSPHRDVKIGAVQYTYALNRNRWKARNELELRLDPSDHYLLYRY